MNQPLELLEIESPFETEQLRPFADPLPSQVAGLELIAAIRFRVIGLGGFGVCDGLDAKHKVPRTVRCITIYNNFRMSKNGMKLQTDALRDANEELHRAIAFKLAGCHERLPAVWHD